VIASLPQVIKLPFCDVLLSPGPEIALRRLEAGPIGGSLTSTARDRDQLSSHALVPCRDQKLLNGGFRPGVLAFAEVMMPDFSLGIDEVEGRPVLVLEGIPDGMVAVHRDGVAHSEGLGSPADVVDVLLESELRGVHPDHDQPPIPVFLRPGAEVRL
jgi:hypothetical protein